MNGATQASRLATVGALAQMRLLLRMWWVVVCVLARVKCRRCWHMHDSANDERRVFGDATAMLHSRSYDNMLATTAGGHGYEYTHFRRQPSV